MMPKPPEDTVPDMVTIDDISKLLDAKLAGLATVEMVQASEKRLRAEMETQIEGVRNAIPTKTQIVKIVKDELSPFVEQFKAAQAAFMDEVRNALNEVKVSVARVESSVASMEKAGEKRAAEIALLFTKTDELEKADGEQAATLMLIRQDTNGIRRSLFGDPQEKDGQETVFGSLRMLREGYTDFKKDMSARLANLATSIVEGDRLNGAHITRLGESFTLLDKRIGRIETEMGKYRKWLAGGLKLVWNFVTSRRGAALVGGAGTLGALIKALIDNLPSVILMAWLAIVLSGCI